MGPETDGGVLLDSSFLVAFHNGRDVHHQRGVDAMGRLARGDWGEPLLLEYVFLEVVTVLAARRDQAAAARVGDRLLGHAAIRFLPCSELFVEAYEVFRREAGLSFVDAALVAAARALGAKILTFDRDFASFPDLVAR